MENRTTPLKQLKESFNLLEESKLQDVGYDELDELRNQCENMIKMINVRYQDVTFFTLMVFTSFSYSNNKRKL